MTAVRLCAALGVLLAASLVTASPLTYRHELPPEEAITDPPSLAPEEREELQAYLTNVTRYYSVRHWDAVAQEYFEFESSLYDTPGRAGNVLRNTLARGDLEGWDRRNRRWNRVSLRPEHDPWVFKATWALLAQNPVDWSAVYRLAHMQTEYVETDPRWIEIAEYLLQLPLIPPSGDETLRTRGGTQNTGGWLYFLIHWPEEASRTLATVVTLPHQPDDRTILPPDPEVSAEVVRESEEDTASKAMSRLKNWATPEELAEVASYIEADLEAGAFELDAETEEWLERIRR